MSPFGGNPGRLTTFTALAIPISDRATSSACFCPTSSLSGKMTTERSRKNAAYSFFHLPAPPGLQVATSPRETRRSTSFSPSGMQTALSDPRSPTQEADMALFRTSLTDQDQPPSALGTRCRKVFGSILTTWKSRSPCSSR